MKYNPLKNQKGVALLITLFAITVMIFLAVEIAYNTSVELKVGAAQVDRLKAYYLAKAGVQISLLRINAYNTVVTKFGAQLGANKSDLDMIWQFPFSWPPIIPKEISSVDKDQIDAAVKKSSIDGAFSSTIEGETGKIDINDLDSPSPVIQKATFAQLTLMIQNRLNQDDDWARDHRNLKPLEIVNNIADWIDADNNSRNGGNETSYYQETDPPIKPPNRPMKTLEELHMVAGMTDEIYNVLFPYLTLWGEKTVNVNYAGKDVLRSIDPQITENIADQIVERRTSQDQGKGPFANVADFTNYLATLGVNTKTFDQNPPVPITVDSVTNFKVKSSGVFGKATREIIAIVYDFGKVKAGLAANMGSPSPSPGASPNPSPTVPGSPAPGVSPSPTTTPTPANSSTAGPQIVYWEEF